MQKNISFISLLWVPVKNRRPCRVCFRETKKPEEIPVSSGWPSGFILGFFLNQLEQRASSTSFLIFT